MAQQSQNGPSLFENPWRLGGLAGVVFVVLFIIGATVQGDSPHYGDSAADVRDFFATDSNRYIVGDWIIVIAFMFFFLPFATCLRAILEGTGAANALWARLSWMGAIIGLAISGASAGAFGAIASTKAEGLDDSTLLFVLGLDNYVFSIGAVALGLMAGAASIVIIRTGVVWRWIAILGFAAMVLNVVGDLATTQHSGDSFLDFLGLIGLLATAIFVLAVSIMMLVHKEQTAAMPAPQASPSAVSG